MPVKMLNYNNAYYAPIAKFIARSIKLANTGIAQDPELEKIAREIPLNLINVTMEIEIEPDSYFYSSLLSFAIIYNILPAFHILLKLGADPNTYSDSVRSTCLTIAINNLNPFYATTINNLSPVQRAAHIQGEKIALQVVKELLSHPKIDLNLINTLDFKTALMYLVTYDQNLDLVKKYIQQGADLYLRDNDDMTVLHHAIQNNSIAIVEFLLTQMRPASIIPDSASLLQIAIRQGNKKIIEILCKKGVDVNATDQMVLTSEDDLMEKTALIEAISKNLEMVACLVELGAEINFRNNQGRTPLFFACTQKNMPLKIIEYLLSKGADLNIVDDKGMNLLDAAIDVHFNNVEIIKFLWERRKDLPETSHQWPELVKNKENFDYLKSLGISDEGVDPIFHPIEKSEAETLILASAKSAAELQKTILDNVKNTSIPQNSILMLLIFYNNNRLDINGCKALYFMSGKKEYEYLFTQQLRSFILLKYIQLYRREVISDSNSKTLKLFLVMSEQLITKIADLDLEAKQLIIRQLFLVFQNTFVATVPATYGYRNVLDADSYYSYYQFMKKLTQLSQEIDSESAIDILVSSIRVIFILNKAVESGSHKLTTEKINEFRMEGFLFLNKLFSITDAQFQIDYVEFYQTLAKNLPNLSEEHRQDVKEKWDAIFASQSNPQEKRAEKQTIIEQVETLPVYKKSKPKKKKADSLQPQPESSHSSISTSDTSAHITTSAEPRFLVQSEPVRESHHIDRQYIKTLKKEIAQAAKIAKIPVAKKAQPLVPVFNEQQVREYFKHILKEGDILKPLLIQNQLGAGWAIIRIKNAAKEAEMAVQKKFDSDENFINISDTDDRDGITHNPNLGYRIKCGGGAGYRALSTRYSIKQEGSGDEKFPFLVHFDEVYPHDEAERVCDRRTKDEIDQTLLIDQQGTLLNMVSDKDANVTMKSMKKK
jgi:ankyrin repeat protein